MQVVLLHLPLVFTFLSLIFLSCSECSVIIHHSAFWDIFSGVLNILNVVYEQFLDADYRNYNSFPLSRHIFMKNVRNNFCPSCTISDILWPMYIHFTYTFPMWTYVSNSHWLQNCISNTKINIIRPFFTVIYTSPSAMDEISSVSLSFRSFRHRCCPSWACSSSLPSCLQSIHLHISFPFPVCPGEIFHRVSLTLPRFCGK